MAVRKQGWSVQEAAEKAGLSESYLYKLIYGGWFKEGEYQVFTMKQQKGKKPRTHYTINSKGMRHLLNEEPCLDIDDYLDEIAKRMAAIVRT